MFYEEIFSALNAAGIRYLVVGGVAMVLHGAVRLTVDLDLVVALDSANVLKFIGVMKKMGYRSRVPVEMEAFADPKQRESWIVDKGLTVYSLNHPSRHTDLIDVFVKEPFDFNQAYDRRTSVQAGQNLVVPVASVDDMIALKKKAGRPQDLADIKALENLR